MPYTFVSILYINYASTKLIFLKNRDKSKTDCMTYAQSRRFSIDRPPLGAQIKSWLYAEISYMPEWKIFFAVLTPS